ncbi:MAG: glycosyltransferase family 39 protein [bacterium]|nr:glycosyltransferase family 39 protein [bacterium]
MAKSKEKVLSKRVFKIIAQFIRSNIDLIFLVLFSSFFFLWGLGKTYLTNWDEAWYAGISRNMLIRHDFIVPFWNGAPYFDKGPLYHWLSVIAFQFTRNWELSARFPAAFASIGSVVLAYWLAKTLFNRKVAIVAGLILSSTIGFLYRGRTGNLDSLSKFFILLSFLSIFLGRKNQKFFLLFGISLGLLFLVKSGLIFYPLLVISVFILWERNFRLLKNTFFLGGIFIGLLIAGSWLFLGAVLAGKSFIDFYFNPLFWFFLKFGSVSDAPSQFSTNYILYLLYSAKVWFLVFIPAVLFALTQIFKDKSFFFLILAFVPFFLVLLGVKDAGDWYLVPLNSIFAIISAAFIVKIQEKVSNKKAVAIALIIVVFSLSLLQNIRYHSSFIVPESVKDEVELAMIAKGLTGPKETIIVDDYNFPVASFYSERKIKVLRREARDTNLVISKNTYYRLLQNSQKVVILTTPENMQITKNDLKDVRFHTIKQFKDHLLIEKP